MNRKPSRPWSRSTEDWMRGDKGLEPRKMDRQEKLIIVFCILCSAYFVLLLIEGAARG